MKEELGIFLLLFLSLLSLFCPSASEEQVAVATVGVTLTVIPRPGVSFIPAQSVGGLSQDKYGGITIYAASNISVVFDFADHDKKLYTSHPDHNETCFFTSDDLKDLSRVEVVYLGN